MMMEDPPRRGSGLKLYTNAYKLKEVQLLIEALDKNFSI